MKGLSNPEEIVRFRIPDSLHEVIAAKITDLEKETAAIISFREDGDVVEVSGYINGVTNAAMNIEHTINVFIKEQNVAGTDLCAVETHEEQAMGITLNSDNHISNASTDGENLTEGLPPRFYIQTRDEDNFADSENGHPCSRNNYIKHGNFRLGNENDIQVKGECLCDENEHSKVGGCSCMDSSLKQGGSNYGNFAAPPEASLTTDLMEFGVKLGYSEDEVKSAMKKLGTETPVNQNELLHELIKASTSAKQIGKGDEAKIENTSGYPRPADVSILRHVVIDGSNVAMRYVRFP